MPKSPLSKDNKQAKHVKKRTNIAFDRLTIPYQQISEKYSRDLDISHLLHINSDIDQKTITNRYSLLIRFCKKANEYVEKGKSARTVTRTYEVLKSYIYFCDVLNTDPFLEAGYLKYAGNDGELRHRVRVYNPAKQLWERQHGEEIGIKESTACGIISTLLNALSWCGLSVYAWKAQHRPFSSINTTNKGYTDEEEKLIVTRLSDLFFTLAPQLISAKQNNIELPNKLLVTINIDERKEVLSIPTTLNSARGKVNFTAAFNLIMIAAYHLFCYFTSLNDSVIRGITHPITTHTDERDKSLKTIKVSGFKARSNQVVDAVLTNETEESEIFFDVEKKSGVLFIQTLAELSKLYGEKNDLLFLLDNNKNEYDKFPTTELNKHLTIILNLVSPQRAKTLPWFRELFYTYRKHQIISLKKTTDKLGRVVVSKVTMPITNKSKVVQGLINTSYCILSCYTDSLLKGIMLPLHYSDKDDDGNITVSFDYQCGTQRSFIIPAKDKELIEDIEKLAAKSADRQVVKKEVRLLLKRGHAHESPKHWEGIVPISSNLMRQWSIMPGEYFIQISSSRFRETTSFQEYKDGHLSHLVSLLQNTLNTLNKHYANGNPQLNKVILSQSIKVLENMAQGLSLESAKEHVKATYSISMLAYDEYLKRNQPTTPNGIICNGQQIVDGKNSQRETTEVMGVALPCTEYDMCYKCKSAKAVDEVQAIYKLISFIDLLKEAHNQLPNASYEVIEKIEAFEYTLDGASPKVYQEAITLFVRNGRHRRVSIDHAILSI